MITYATLAIFPPASVTSTSNPEVVTFEILPIFTEASALVWSSYVIKQLIAGMLSYSFGNITLAFLKYPFKFTVVSSPD